MIQLLAATRSMGVTDAPVRHWDGGDQRSSVRSGVIGKLPILAVDFYLGVAEVLDAQIANDRMVGATGDMKTVVARCVVRAHSLEDQVFEVLVWRANFHGLLEF